MSERRDIVEHAIVTEDDTQAVSVTSNRRAPAVVLRISAGTATLSFVWSPADAEAIGRTLLAAAERVAK